MHGQLRMLNFACTAKARKRTVTLTRPSREEALQFHVVGGYEKGFGIFVSRVDPGSKVRHSPSVQCVHIYFRNFSNFVLKIQVNVTIIC
jgi:Rap guanine nucleotide exchange factor 2